MTAPRNANKSPTNVASPSDSPAKITIEAPKNPITAPIADLDLIGFLRSNKPHTITNGCEVTKSKLRGKVVLSNDHTQLPKCNHKQIPEKKCFGIKIGKKFARKIMAKWKSFW